MGSRTRDWYDPRLDVLRLGAFLCVFVSHTLDVSTFFPHPGKQRLGALVMFGLILFFVLSAFLLTRLLMLEVQATGSFSVSRYLQRRTLRIWPLYFTAVLGAVLIALALASFPGLAHRTGVEPGQVIQPPEVPAYSLFYANWYLSVHEATGDFLPHLWSLSVEEQFYVALPVLFVLAARW